MQSSFSAGIAGGPAAFEFWAYIASFMNKLERNNELLITEKHSAFVRIANSNSLIIL